MHFKPIFGYIETDDSHLNGHGTLLARHLQSATRRAGSIPSGQFGDVIVGHTKTVSAIPTNMELGAVTVSKIIENISELSVANMTIIADGLSEGAVQHYFVSKINNCFYEKVQKVKADVAAFSYLFLPSRILQGVESYQGRCR